MKKIFHILFFTVVLWLFSVPVAYAHLCDNVFRQADKLIVKPENYNMVVKDEATFKIFLQNNMDRGIAEIELLGESPAFDFTITPKKMLIPKDQRVFFTVTMRTRPEVKTGLYPIHFRLVGGGRQFKSFSLNMQSGASETEEIRETDVANLLIVKSTSHKLKLDGELDEELWKNSAVVSNFSSLEGGEAISPTVVLITFDKDCLYFGVYCVGDDSERSSEGDTIELQLATDYSGLAYHSITLPGDGMPSFKKVFTGGRSSLWEGHNIGYAFAKDKKLGIAEVSIPFTALDTEAPTSQEGVKYYMRIVRTNVSGKAETSYWAADSSGYNREEGFGEFILIP